MRISHRINPSINTEQIIYKMRHSRENGCMKHSKVLILLFDLVLRALEDL